MYRTYPAVIHIKPPQYHFKGVIRTRPGKGNAAKTQKRTWLMRLAIRGMGDKDELPINHVTPSHNQHFCSAPQSNPVVVVVEMARLLVRIHCTGRLCLKRADAARAHCAFIRDAIKARRSSGHSGLRRQCCHLPACQPHRSKRLLKQTWDSVQRC